MPYLWKWDQGRLSYFSYDNIVRIAIGLSQLEGIDLKSESDPLRNILTEITPLPFLPTHYKVWRNYKRVFETCLLATRVNDRLALTDICKILSAITDDKLGPDEYLSIHFSRF